MGKIFKKIIFGIFLLILYQKVVICETVEGVHYVMGTTLYIKITGNNKKILKQILNKCFLLVNSLDEKLSIFKKDSEINKINSNLEKWIEVSNITQKILKLSHYYNKITDGYFDISYHTHKKKYLKFDKNKIKTNTKIDLGGIGKGYALDEVLRFVKDYNIKELYADFGGQLLLYSKITGFWEINIRHPLKKNENIETFYLSKNNTYSVSTSGNYEKKYPHIINPKNNKPVDGKILSVTVISNNPTSADVFSTSIFASGGKLLKKDKKLPPYIIFYKNGKNIKKIASKDFYKIVKPHFSH